MARQTLAPFEWIVLDDGATPVQCTMGQRHYRFDDTRGKASLVLKLRKVIDGSIPVNGDVVAIIEDDDWYSPKYLEVAESRLSDYEMVGEGNALYYNIRARRWYVHNNDRHASLCQTVFRPSLLPAMKPMVANTDPFLDWRLWFDLSPDHPKKVFLPETHAQHTLVGIKGLYPGYGMGHKNIMPQPDLEMKKLISIIGAEDAKCYETYYFIPG